MVRAMISVALFATCASPASAKNVQVFLLAGQSNMEGKGVAYESSGQLVNGTLLWQLNVNHSYLPLCHTMEQAPKVGCRAEGANFSGLYDNSTQPPTWTSFPGVYAAYKGSNDRNGTMTVGYGFQETWIGPEYGFGKTMGEYFAGKSDVLVLKVCWGGTAIETDWRPPSSGGDAPGWCYSNMTKIVHEALNSNLDKLVPGFNYGTDAWNLTAFGWHQGWNDGCGQKSADDYAVNLANLIHDVRAEFDSPRLPVTIGLSGFGGWGQDVGRRLEIMAAQYNVTQNAALGLGSVAAVETRGFFRSFTETHGAINQGYHWFGNAETYFYIGTAMAEAAKLMLQGQWKQPFIDTKPPSEDTPFGENDDTVW